MKVFIDLDRSRNFVGFESFESGNDFGFELSFADKALVATVIFGIIFGISLSQFNKRLATVEFLLQFNGFFGCLDRNLEKVILSRINKAVVVLFVMFFYFFFFYFNGLYGLVQAFGSQSERGHFLEVFLVFFTLVQTKLFSLFLQNIHFNHLVQEFLATIRSGKSGNSLGIGVVDDVLQFFVVTAAGNLVTANFSQHVFRIAFGCSRRSFLGEARGD